MHYPLNSHLITTNITIASHSPLICGSHLIQSRFLHDDALHQRCLGGQPGLHLDGDPKGRAVCHEALLVDDFLMGYTNGSIHGPNVCIY